MRGRKKIKLTDEGNDAPLRAWSSSFRPHCGQNDTQGGPSWTSVCCPPPHSALSCPWEFQPFLTTRGLGCVPRSPKSRLQAETLPVSHRAISLVSCRAVAILIMSLRRGIPPSLISRGQYLSAMDRDRQQVIRVGFLSACCSETHPCCKNCPPRRRDEDSALSEGTAATGQEPCLPSPGAQVLRPPGGSKG